MAPLSFRRRSPITHPKTSKTMTKRKGEFEACFAKGLDLSEFTTSARTTTTTSNTTSGVLPVPTNVASSSHSARLLQIKQVEAAMKFENDQQEVETQNLIAARVEQLKLPVTASKANQNRPYRLQMPPPPSHSAVKSTNETVHSDISNRNMIRNVLVGMHEETIQKGYDHMPRKMLSKRHPNRNDRKSSQKPITKKTTRRKY